VAAGERPRSTVASCRGALAAPCRARHAGHARRGSRRALARAPLRCGDRRAERAIPRARGADRRALVPALRGGRAARRRRVHRVRAGAAAGRGAGRAAGRGAGAPRDPRHAPRARSRPPGRPEPGAQSDVEGPGTDSIRGDGAVSKGGTARALRRHLIAGLVVIAPVGITAAVLWWLFQRLDGLLGRFLYPQLPFPIPGLGLLLLLAILALVGS